MERYQPGGVAGSDFNLAVRKDGWLLRVPRPMLVPLFVWYCYLQAIDASVSP